MSLLHRDGLLAWFPDTFADQPTQPQAWQHQPITLVLPGFAVFRYLLPAVRAATGLGMPCVLVSPPGMAGSAAEPPAPSIPLAADAICRWATRNLVQVERVVGHSTGCAVAATVAASIGPACRQLALVSPAIDPAFRSLPLLASKMLSAGRHEKASMVPGQLREWWTSRDSVTAFFRSCRDFDLLAALDAVELPTIVVRGLQDPLSRYEWAAELTGRAANGAPRTLVNVPGAGHAFPYHRPELFTRALSDGFAALDRAGTR